jgi:hypothetical protein
MPESLCTLSVLSHAAEAASFNNGMQRTTFRAGVDAERSADGNQNSVVAIFDYEVAAQGNTRAQLREWK